MKDFITFSLIGIIGVISVFNLFETPPPYGAPRETAQADYITKYQGRYYYTDDQGISWVLDRDDDGFHWRSDQEYLGDYTPITANNAVERGIDYYVDTNGDFWEHENGTWYNRGRPNQ